MYKADCVYGTGRELGGVGQRRQASYERHILDGRALCGGMYRFGGTVYTGRV